MRKPKRCKSSDSGKKFMPIIVQEIDHERKELESLRILIA